MNHEAIYALYPDVVTIRDKRMVLYYVMSKEINCRN